MTVGSARALTAGTIDELILEAAARWPERRFAHFDDDEWWSYGDVLTEAARAANALAAVGVERSDRVLLLLPNGRAWLRAWWGAALLGAIVVPANPAHLGRVLSDLCDLVDPAVIVAEQERSDTFEERHRKLLVDPAVLVDAPADLPNPAATRPEHTHALVMTSGTTGASKASITTHATMLHYDEFLLHGTGMSADDVYLADMPLFHVAGIAPTIQMMRIGAKVAVRATPDLKNYWAVARKVGATYSLAPGTVTQFLEAQPPSPADGDHSMRFVLCSPLPADPDAFARRFGLQGITTAYGSTEGNMSLVNMLDVPLRPGSCGKVRSAFTVKIVNDEGDEVGTGEVGELIVHCSRPGLQSQGYFRNEEATARIFRDGWFHTGDAFTRDDDGYYYYHDRVSDCLRRRGENISSFEVEREVLSHPSVTEAACVAYPDGYGGDDVKVFVVTNPDMPLEPAELLIYVSDRMPYFMVPRYFEFVTELPKTASRRVQKGVLRERGNSEATWDRDTAGFTMTRNGLARATDNQKER
jgi:carnitine-CoA ligase